MVERWGTWSRRGEIHSEREEVEMDYRSILGAARGIR